MADIESGLDRPVPNPEKNSPQSLRNRLDNGTKLLPISQEGKILRGRNRWGLVLPLAGILATAAALAVDPVADYLFPLQSLDNSHRTSYSPPQRDLGIPAHIVDQVNKYLGVRTARGDSGAPSVYKIFGPAIYGRAPEPSVQLRDPDAITPEECRTLTTSYPGVVITESTLISLIGAVVVFPDQEQALNTARTSTYYHDLLYQRLTLAVNFFSKHLPFRFEINIHPEPLLFPQAFGEIEERLSHHINLPQYLESYRINNGLPIRKYPEYYEIIRRGGYHDIEYPIYTLMYAPDQTITPQELRRRGHASAIFGRAFTSTRGGGVAAVAVFPWYSANPDSLESKRSVVEHEITHGLGVLEHDPINQNSVVSASGAPPLDRAIITRDNVAGMCSP